MTTEDAIERCERLTMTGNYLSISAEADAIRTVLARLATVERERRQLIERWPGNDVYQDVDGRWTIWESYDSYPTREAAVLAAAGIEGGEAKGGSDAS